jgi:lipoate-protein ligase A
MYVAPGEVVTYSLYLPEGAVTADVEESYAELDAPAIAALTDLGMEAFHEPLNDIAHPDGKVGGSAQLRVDGAVLHHTTMSYDLDVREMLRVLRIGKEKVSDKAVKSAEKRVTRIADYVDADRETVVQALEDAFRAVHGGERGSLTAEELSAARRLADEKFATDEWNRQF